MKILKPAICVLLILLISGSFMSLAESDISVEMNGKIISFDEKPYIENGRTMVPLRKVCEKLGAVVDWDAPSTITITKSGTVLVLKIGMDTATKNGQAIKLESPPKIVGEKTFIPVRFVAEGLGAAVDYNPATKRVTINYQIVRGNSIGNIIMRGDTAKEGNYIYASAYHSSGLWKIDLDTLEKELICPYPATDINIIDGWIYANFYTSDSLKHRGAGLYRLKTDGTQVTKLSDLYFVNISVVNNKIYGISWEENCIYSMNLDGTQQHKLINYGFSTLNVTEHTLYMSNNSIRAFDLDTGELTEALNTRVPPEYFIIDGDYIYYYASGYDNGFSTKLCKAPIDGSSEPITIINDLYRFNISNGYIYYVKLSHSGVYKATTDGTNIEKISDIHVDCFDIIDDYLYCSKYLDNKIIMLKTDGSFEQEIELYSE